MSAFEPDTAEEENGGALQSKRASATDPRAMMGDFHIEVSLDGEDLPELSNQAFKWWLETLSEVITPDDDGEPYDQEYDQLVLGFYVTPTLVAELQRLREFEGDVVVRVVYRDFTHTFHIDPDTDLGWRHEKGAVSTSHNYLNAGLAMRVESAEMFYP